MHEGSGGQLVYDEATITIFEKSFDVGPSWTRVLVKTGVRDMAVSKDESMVGTFAHEVDHNVNQNAIKTVVDNSSGGSNGYDVEEPAYNVQKEVPREIFQNRDN